MTMTKAEIARRYRAKCKKEGRCTECGKPLSDHTYLRCESCRNKHKEIVKRSREYYRRIGICPYCHKEHLYNGERMCVECKAKSYAWFATHKRKRYNDTDRKRRLREEREKEGLCVRCGKRDAQPGRKRCSICLAKDREQNRKRHTLAEYRKENGLCKYCDSKAIPGKRFCEYHYQKVCEQLAKVRPRGNAYWKQQNNLIFGKK